MDGNTPRIRSLIRQADRVADDGKRKAAEKLYRQIIDEAPDTAAAWVGLAGVIGDRAEKESAYRQALVLEPDYETAQAGLDELLGVETVFEAKQIELEEADQTETEANISAKLTNSSLAPPNPSLKEGDPLSVEVLDVDPATSVHDHHDLDVAEDGEILFCANHPNRQTHLRCNKCGKPICSSCAQSTPVGYRCPECIREHEDIFYSATALDYVVVVLIALPLSLLGGWLATMLGFLTIFLGAFAGSLIGRLAFRAAGRRRGRWMPQLVGAIVVIGGVLPALPAILYLFFGGFNLQIVWTGIYLFTAAGAAYYQMR